MRRQRVVRAQTDCTAYPHLVPELPSHDKAMHGCARGWFQIHESPRSAPNLTND